VWEPPAAFHDVPGLQLDAGSPWPVGAAIGRVVDEDGFEPRHSGVETRVAGGVEVAGRGTSFHGVRTSDQADAHVAVDIADRGVLPSAARDGGTGKSS
jgi:hypothetical protein